MSMALPSNPSAPPSDLAADQARAETLLAELAGALMRVPVDERTRILHLRALSLKRVVMQWHVEQPEEPARRSVVAEIVSMHEAARDWKSRRFW
jgi:hypothetical protein